MRVIYHIIIMRIKTKCDRSTLYGRVARLCRAMPMPSCGVRLSVRLSVTFVNSVETNKHIFKKCSPSGSHATLVFPYQT